MKSRILFRNFFLLLISVAFYQCTSESPQMRQPEELFARDTVLGFSDDRRLNEISGIVISKTNPGWFWLHNDSGDGPHVYLVDPALKVKQVVTIAEATYFENNQEINRLVTHIDWESISRVTIDGESYLIIADIGDNNAKRDSVFFYKFAEPEFEGQSALSLTAERMAVKYAEGPSDAEVVITDPANGNILVVTKSLVKSRVYSFAFKAESKEVSALGDIELSLLTAGDANSKGDILIKNYSRVYLILNPASKPIAEMIFSSDIKEVNYIIEIQGEALCWGEDDKSYYTTSEKRLGNPQPLVKYY